MGCSISIVFICQQGMLELEAMMLAASLREHLLGPAELIAAVPVPSEVWGDLQPTTRDLLAGLDVQLVEISNPIAPQYAIGNKLACLDIPTQADWRLFLDSDMLALAPLQMASVLTRPFVARIAGRLPCADGVEQLRRAFAAAGATWPAAQMHTLAGEPTCPYFNSGFIAVDAGIGFGREWLACCRAIDADESITCRRPWLDQLGLAAAVQKMGLDYALLDKRYNWPRVEAVSDDSFPLLHHYGEATVLAASGPTRRMAERLCRQHEAIRLEMGRWPIWRDIAAGDHHGVTLGREIGV